MRLTEQDMNIKTYLNKQVSEITGLSQRQVLSWTEKGLIQPFIETTGTGAKREYDYINLLEFELCKTLFLMRTGFRQVKKILNKLKKDNLIRDWSLNFEEYRKIRLEIQLDAIKRYGSKEALDEFSKIPLEKEPIGILILIFDTDNEDDIKYGILPINIEKYSKYAGGWLIDLFRGRDGCILVDIGRLKRRVDEKL